MKVTRSQVRIAVIAVIVVLGIVLVVQNSEQVKTKLFFFSVTMPRAVLLIVTAAIGFVAGLVAAGRITGRKKGENKQ